MQSDPTLAEYLYSRQLKPALDLEHDVEQEILSDDDMLAKIAGLVATYGPTLDALVRCRVQSIVEELVRHAYPAETIVLRQAIAEVSAIADDAAKFALEWKKREDDKAAAAEGTVATEPAEEGSAV
jgi:hypothetical protein